jgi:hypothetical protein
MLGWAGLTYGGLTLAIKGRTEWTRRAHTLAPAAASDTAADSDLSQFLHGLKKVVEMVKH